MLSTQSSPYSGESSTNSEDDANERTFNFKIEDFVTGKMVEPVRDSGDGNNGSLGWDGNYTTTTWADEELFAKKVIVEVWKGFTEKVSKTRDAVNELPRSLSEVQEANQWLDTYRLFLSKNKPTSETHMAFGFMSFADGIACLLRALNRDRGDISIVPSWQLSTERLEKYDPETIVKVVHRAQCTPDLVLVDEASQIEARDHHFPIAAVELKGPRHPITTEDLHKEARVANGFSENTIEEARGFKRFLQDYLDAKEGLEDWNGVGKCHAKAIVEALLTYSGYCVLFCTTWARAMHAFYEKKNGVEVLRIKISRVFHCNEKLSSALCVTTLLNEALGTVIGRLRERRRKNLDSIMRNARACALIGGGFVRGVKDKSGSGNSGGSLGEASGAGGPSHSQSSAHSEQGLKTRWAQRWTEEFSANARRRAVPMFFKFDKKDQRGELGAIIKICEDLENDKVIDMAYQASYGVIGEGICGMVKSTVLEGRSAVIKFWSEQNSEHRLLLLNEMAMYCYLASEYPFVMGNAVPQLLGVGMHYWVGPSLVIEQVGEHFKICSGAAYVGERQLCREEVNQIHRAALRSLAILHQAGCMHGDISLRNMLVAEAHMVQDTSIDRIANGFHYWHVWFIDLGLSRPQSDPKKLESERNSCSKLFHSYLEM